MTNQHPITPPPELVQQWMDGLYDEAGQFVSSDDQALATRAAQWGADQELEACCEWLESEPDPGHVDLLRSCATALRAARRPKPPSLAKEALNQLGTIHIDLSRHCMGSNTDTIRRALERLQQLEDQQ